jgi:hypothetical protein
VLRDSLQLFASLDRGDEGKLLRDAWIATIVLGLLFVANVAATMDAGIVYWCCPAAHVHVGS